MSTSRRRRFKTIVIDPPWPGPGSAPAFDARKKNSNDPMDLSVVPYATLTGIQIANLQIDKLAHHAAQLFIWATSRSIADAYALQQLYGFKYRGLLIWKKPQGLGRHVRHEAEFIVWGGRRGAPLLEPVNVPRQMHEWPRPRNHSEKPAEAYQLIRRISQAPRLDIFARQHRPGFRAWGNQAPGRSNGSEAHPATLALAGH